MSATSFRVLLGVCAAGALAASAGCAGRQVYPTATPLPCELKKVILPDYVIEPPDILLIDALQLVPLPPYKVQPMDVLDIRVPNALPELPIAGLFQVDPDGTVNLGAGYGTVHVVGLTVAEAKAAIAKTLSRVLKEPQVDVSVAQGRGVQQVRGEHLVRPDGTVSLGTYGSVRVTGLTVAEAKAAIEAQLAKYLQSPEVTVDVAAYNSKIYYVIMDGGGNGQQVYRLPITGNETVLDAIGQVNGLGPVASTNHIWVARPSPEGDCDQVLPVDWVGITTLGRTATNYQLLPGDRVYVKAQPLVTLDTYLARVLAPIERVFGVTLLGVETVRSFSGNTNGFGF